MKSRGYEQDDLIEGVVISGASVMNKNHTRKQLQIQGQYLDEEALEAAPTWTAIPTCELIGTANGLSESSEVDKTRSSAQFSAPKELRGWDVRALRGYYRRLVITSLDHIHIHAGDPLATIRFYESCLGAEHLGSIPSGEGGRNHGVLLGGQLLVISEFPPGMKPAEPPEAGAGALRSGFGVAHFGLQTTDLDGVLTRLRDAGAQVHAEPRRTGSIRYVYVSAPDGVVIELVELHLPAHLARFVPLVNGVNHAIHLTRRALAKQLFK